MSYQQRQSDRLRMEDQVNEDTWKDRYLDPGSGGSAANREYSFKLIDGPDGDDLYTGRRQTATDFGTYEDYSPTTDVKIKMQGWEGHLASAATGQRLNGTIVQASFLGNNESGDEIWTSFQPALDFIADPT